MPETVYADWNPWHGCTKISPGCKYCYVYRQDEQYGTELASSLCAKRAILLKTGGPTVFCANTKYLKPVRQILIFYQKSAACSKRLPPILKCPSKTAKAWVGKN